MKHPKVVKFFVFGAYGAAAAISWFNVELSAIGFANGKDIAPVDWALAVGMMLFEGCLSLGLGTPAFWPVLIGSAGTAIDNILDHTGDNGKYQVTAIGLLVLFCVALAFFGVETYKLDYQTTAEAVFPKDGTEPTQAQIAKVWGLIWGSEALLVAAGLAQLAGGIGKVQFNQIQGRSEQLAAHYGDPYGHGNAPDLNA